MVSKFGIHKNSPTRPIKNLAIANKNVTMWRPFTQKPDTTLNCFANVILFIAKITAHKHTYIYIHTHIYRNQ